MSLNRGRNIFTLGSSFAQNSGNKLKSRRQSDPFERDPFKIQSYNFRYAERPVFPVKPMRRSHTDYDLKPFDTYYYNQNFPNYSKNNQDLSAFQAMRRRTFLQNTSSQSQRCSVNSNSPRGLSSKSSSPYSKRPESLVTKSSMYGFPSSSKMNTSHKSNLNSSFLKRSYTDYVLESRNSRDPSNSSTDYNPQRNKFARSNTGFGISTMNDPNRVKTSLNNLSLKKSPNSGNLLKRSYTENILEAPTFSSLKNIEKHMNVKESLMEKKTENSLKDHNEHSTSKTIPFNPKPQESIPFPSRFHQSSHKSQSTTSSLRNQNEPSTSKTNPFNPNPQESAHISALIDQSPARTSRSTCSKRKPSSGCEININIKRLDDDSRSEKVTIHIERNPSKQNLDNTKKKINRENSISYHSNISSNIKLNINSSSKTFSVDKKLKNNSSESFNENRRTGTVSKYSLYKELPKRSSNIGSPNLSTQSKCSMNNNEFKKSFTLRPSLSNLPRDSRSPGVPKPNPANLRVKQSDRKNILNSIYSSSQVINSAYRRSGIRVLNSSERLPSLLPWRDNSL